jgi:hypothetical protein
MQVGSKKVSCCCQERFDEVYACCIEAYYHGYDSFSILPRHHQVTWPGRWKCEKEGTYDGIFVHRIS